MWAITAMQGMEKVLALERKSLSDLITTLIQQRSRFFKMCEKLAQYRWRALLVEGKLLKIQRHMMRNIIHWLTPTLFQALWML